MMGLDIDDLVEFLSESSGVPKKDVRNWLKSLDKEKMKGAGELFDHLEDDMMDLQEIIFRAIMMDERGLDEEDIECMDDFIARLTRLRNVLNDMLKSRKE